MRLFELLSQCTKIDLDATEQQIRNNIEQIQALTKAVMTLIKDISPYLYTPLHTSSMPHYPTFTQQPNPFSFRPGNRGRVLPCSSLTGQPSLSPMLPRRPFAEKTSQAPLPQQQNKPSPAEESPPQSHPGQPE